MSNPPDPYPQQSGPQQNSPQPPGPQHPAGPQPSGQTQWSPQYAAPQYAGQPQPGQPQPGQPPQWGLQPPAGPGGYPGMHPGQKPPKQKKPLLKRWWFWLLVVLVVIIFFSAISGGGGDSTEDTGSTSSQGGSDGGAAEEQDTGEKPAEDKPDKEKAEAAPEYGIGDAVTADGWEITVNKVEDGVSSVGSEYLNTEAQGQFVTVSLSVKNTKSSPEYFFEDNIKLGDDKGNTYSSDSEAGIYADEDSILFLEEINPGNTAEGVLVFDVPEDVTPDRLTFEGGIFSDPVEISLK